MPITVAGLCRGDGKGYIKIVADRDLDSVYAVAQTETGESLPCPLYRLGFPGEDAAAQRRFGEMENMRTRVIAVPLLDDVKLTVRLYERDAKAGDGTTGGAAPQPLLSIPFDPFWSKVRSRLTYKRHGELARQIRGIDQRRLSGNTYVYVVGIYPVEEGAVSCRFHVRMPFDGRNERCDIEMYDSAMRRIQADLQILEHSVITDPHDSACQIREIVYAARLQDDARTVCIYAKPQFHEANFTCILPDMFSGFRTAALDFTKHASYDEGYAQWFEQHRATHADVENQRAVCRQWDSKPLISIVTVVFRPPVEYLRALIDSVKAQSYENFEMIIVNVSGDDAKAGEVNAMLASLDDGRFTVLTAGNKSIAENTNIGIDAAHGEYIAFVDHDDVIEPDALYRYMTVIREYPQVDMLYCDEDLLDNGTYRWPVFKPDFNPDLLYSYNYVTHMLMVSRHVLGKVELSPADVSGAQDYDLTLKCAEQARLVRNVPHMLYHWRMHQASTSTNPDSKPYAQTAGRIALERHYERVGIKAEVGDSELPFRYRTRFIVDKPAKISIVIPTKDHADVLARCLDSVFANAAYGDFDVTLVENNSVEERTFAYYEQVRREHENVSVITWPGTGFNYSAICNYGAAHSDGDLILFLNNDTEVISPDWLESMAGFFVRPEVGVVGAKLLYHDDLVQHGGVWASMDHCGHFGELLSYKDGGYMESMRFPNDCAAVTGACQMIRRDLFERIGGLDEDQAVVLNDVDLCLKAGQEGYLVVFDPQTMLYHNEHTSRGRDEQDVKKELRAIQEQARFYAKWNHALERGRYINANLNQYDGHYRIRW